MNKEERNKILLVVVVIAMLFSVVCISIYLSFKDKKYSTETKIVLSQVYSSDYDLEVLDDNYYIGKYDNTLYAIINNEGKEVYKSDYGITDPFCYKMKDGNYLIYSYSDNILRLYKFDGNDVILYRSYESNEIVKPILFRHNDDTYIIGLCSNINNNLVLYDLYENNVLTVPDTLLLSDFINDNIYYSNSDNSLIVMKDNMVGAIDLNGNVIIDFKYNNLVNSNNNYIALNDKNLYGVIDRENNILIKFNYVGISYYEDYYLVINNKNKMALFDKEFNNITGFNMDYNSLKDFSLKDDNSFYMYHINDNYIVLNNYNEDLYNTEYSKHNMYIINDNKIVDTIDEIGFGYNNNLIYSYDKDYNVSLYNEYMVFINKFKIEDISSIKNIFYVFDYTVVDVYLDDGSIKRICYDKDYNLIDDNINYGELVLFDDNYYVFTDGKNINVINSNLDVVLNKTGDNVIVNDNYVIIDHDIYLIKES